MQLDRHYADVSLFRQPYKTWMSLTGLGAAALPSMPAESAAFVDMGPTGVVTLKPQAKVVAQNFLATQVVVPITAGNDDDVGLENGPLEGYELYGVWLVRKIQQGKIVLVGSAGGIAGFFTPGFQPKFLKAVSTDADAITATGQGMYAELGRPGPNAPKPPMAQTSGLFAKIGPIGVAAVALVAVGGIYLIVGKKRHAAPNRRRHRRS